jgi:hypothetical protein
MSAAAVSRGGRDGGRECARVKAADRPGMSGRTDSESVINNYAVKMVSSLAGRRTLFAALFPFDASLHCRHGDGFLTRSPTQTDACAAAAAAAAAAATDRMMQFRRRFCSTDSASATERVCGP